MDSLILLIRLGAYLVSEPLLALALFSMGLVLAGTLILHRFPVGGQVLHWVGNAGVFLALVLTALQVVRASQRYRPAPALPLPLPISLDGQQTDATGLSGNEIRVPLASDGNFWIEATINGRPERFLVDTGATITIIPPGAARSALVTDEAGRQSVQLRTANGTVQAKPVTIAQCGSAPSSRLSSMPWWRPEPAAPAYWA